VNERNYRYYDQNTLRRLQEIQLLKSLGFTLKQIKQKIDVPIGGTDEEKWVRSLQKQIQLIQKEKENLERKQYYLQSTVHAIQITGQIQAGEIFALIQSLENRKMENGIIPATFPDELFPDEEHQILKRLPVLGSDDPRLKEMIELVKQIRQNMDKPATDAVIQKFADSIHVQMVSVFQGNTELMEKYWKLISPKENQDPIVYGLDHELVSYIDQMMEYYYKQQE
jgi:DNA-binding transcriptional MerR regulator